MIQPVVAVGFRQQREQILKPQMDYLLALDDAKVDGGLSGDHEPTDGVAAQELGTGRGEGTLQDLGVKVQQQRAGIGFL